MKLHEEKLVIEDDTITKDGLQVKDGINDELGLLRREIPMAWYTKTNSLTPEINPFQYAIEIKCLTVKDQTSYLISDS